MERNLFTRTASACRRWATNERGLSSIAIFILGMPLILLAFGFGIDILRVGEAKRVAQGRLDIAVQAAAAMTYTNLNGAVRIGTAAGGSAAALQRATSLYAENTARYRGAGSSGSLLACNAGTVTQQNTVIWRDNATRTNPADNTCSGTAYIVYTGAGLLGPPQDFDFCQRPANGKYGVKYEVQERVPTTFMGLVPGAPDFFDIRVSSEALLRQQYC